MNNSAAPYKSTRCENGQLNRFANKNDLFFICTSIFALHKYIFVIRTFSLSGQAPASSSPGKRGSNVLFFLIF